MTVRQIWRTLAGMATYQSKLEPGQTAWFLSENKVVSMTIGKVMIISVADEHGKPSHKTVKYGFRLPDIYGKFKAWEEREQSECFASKEELLASL